MFDAFPAALADAAIHPKSSLAPMDSCGLQVIQLLECPPPPPGPPRSTCASSSYASSSYNDVSEDEDDDEPCTSYCSSVSDLPEPTLSDPSRRAASSAAMSRITAWRKSSALRADDAGASDHFSPTLSLTRTPETSSAASGKRKLVHNGEGNEDSVGATLPFHSPLSHPLPQTLHCPKRPRERPVPAPTDPEASAQATFACPACDGTFPSVQALQQHGEEARAHDCEPCLAAVQYALE
ncbi:hypothetical protein GGG16DRAFT_120968 [Schizophyllum commune]